MALEWTDQSHSRATNTQSLLLSLAQEILDTIWTNLVGGYNIHILYNDAKDYWMPGYTPRYPGIKKTALYRIACPQKPNTFAMSYPTFSQKQPLTERLRTWHDEIPGVCANLGKFCDDPCPFVREDRTLPPQAPSHFIQALLICKKAYLDILPILYSKNTFSFEDNRWGNETSSTFSIFLKSIPTFHHEFLRTLHFRVPTLSPIERPNDIEFSAGLGSLRWLTVEENAKFALLSNLRMVSVLLLRSFDGEAAPVRGIRTRMKEGVARMTMAEFGYLGKLRLKELHVQIWNETDTHGRGGLVHYKSIHCDGRTFTRGGDKGLEKRLRAYLLGLEAKDAGASVEELE